LFSLSEIFSRLIFAVLKCNAQAAEKKYQRRENIFRKIWKEILNRSLYKVTEAKGGQAHSKQFGREELRPV
jgi:hypothetical protein